MLVSWELPDELMQDGQPMVISKRYTFSASKNSHLRADLEAWRAKAFRDDEIAGFDLRQLLGVAALLTVTHWEGDNGVRAQVETVSKVMKGMQVPKKAHNPLVSLVLSAEDFDKVVFDSLSDGLKERIAKSPEYQFVTSGKTPSKASDHQKPIEDDFDDQIPF